MINLLVMLIYDIRVAIVVSEVVVLLGSKVFFINIRFFVVVIFDMVLVIDMSGEWRVGVMFYMIL